MIILGIETSCDETSVAIVEDGRLVRSNIVASQIPIHERFGGVVPEVASRQHILAIDGVFRKALEMAHCTLADVDAIGVTYGPGLSGPLLVGLSFAKGLFISSRIPLLAVNHIEGHLLSVWLSDPEEETLRQPELPMVSLVVSGGHTQLVLVTSPGSYRLLGSTVDDAAGEAFDKVGRLLGLPYPGGPSIEIAARDGTAGTTKMPRAWMQGTLDFSFSGLKTAMVREVRQQQLTTQTIADLAREFQESVADVLSSKLATASAEFGAASAAVVGGVASNGRLRELAAQRLNIPLFTPAPGLSTDNAAMIAGAAYWRQNRAALDLDVAPSVGFL